jgi:hypothetical protein
MKSRIVFILTLAAFFNPASVLALETKDSEQLGSKIGCNRPAAKALSEMHSDVSKEDLKKIINEAKAAKAI